MKEQVLTENQVHIINGLSPVADAFSGTVYSDVIDASQALWLTFIVYWGVGATGTTTLTVIPCDDTTPSNRGTAVAFTSRNLTAGDVWGNATARAAAGFFHLGKRPVDSYAQRGRTGNTSSEQASLRVINARTAARAATVHADEQRTMV